MHLYKWREIMRADQCSCAGYLIALTVSFQQAGCAGCKSPLINVMAFENISSSYICRGATEIQGIVCVEVGYHL